MYVIQNHHESQDVMGRLKDRKQELFANGVASGLTKTEAFRRAGYSAKSTAHSSRMAAYPHVAARIQELTDEQLHKEKRLNESRRTLLIEKSATATDIKEWLQLELVHNVGLARDLGNVPAANKALELIAKMNGILRDDREGNQNAAKPKEPNKELHSRDPQPETTINVQVLNRISASPSGEIGESAPDEQRALLDRLRRALPIDGTPRLGRAAPSIAGSDRPIGAGLSRDSEAELVEESELLCGMDDA